MSKKLCYILLSIILILGLYIPTYASNASADLIINNSSIKVGETFSVVLSVKCSNGINGIADLTSNYDSNVVELVNSKVKDSNYINLGTDNVIDLLCNSKETITSSDILEFTFKVKDNAKLDSKSIITISNFIIDSDETEDSVSDIDAQKLEISIDKDGNVSIKKVVSSNSNSFPLVLVIIIVLFIIGIFLIINVKNKNNHKNRRKNK